MRRKNMKIYKNKVYILKKWSFNPSLYFWLELNEALKAYDQFIKDSTNAGFGTHGFNDWRQWEIWRQPSNKELTLTQKIDKEVTHKQAT